MLTMDTGYTLVYETGEMNLNYFHYYRNKCIRGVEEGYGEKWADMRKRGFRIAKIQASEIIP